MIEILRTTIQDYDLSRGSHAAALVRVLDNTAHHTCSLLVFVALFQLSSLWITSSLKLSLSYHRPRAVHSRKPGKTLLQNLVDSLEVPCSPHAGRRHGRNTLHF